MHYKQNFLTAALARIDFASTPITSLTTPSNFSDRIRDLFPHVTSQPVASMQITLGPSGPGIDHQAGGIQLVHTVVPNGTKRAVLGPTYLSFEHGVGDYGKFETFEEEFQLLYRSLQELFPTVRPERVGLRYINEITGPGTLLDWDNEISPQLLNAAKAGFPPDSRILRSMHQSLLKRGDDQATFHFGVWNQDYPAPAARKLFVLDIDAFRDSLDPQTDVMVAFRSLNALATDIFEMSILDDLRTRMGVITS